jgi:hypothetical protein
MAKNTLVLLSSIPFMGTEPALLMHLLFMNVCCLQMIETEAGSKHLQTACCRGSWL